MPESFDIKPKGFDIKRGYPKPKEPKTIEGSPKKPKDPDTEITLKDSKTFLMKFTNQEFLALILGDSNSIGRWIRVIIAVVILALMTWNSIF